LFFVVYGQANRNCKLTVTYVCAEYLLVQFSSMLQFPDISLKNPHLRHVKK